MRKEIEELFEKWRNGAGIVIDTRTTSTKEQEWLNKKMEEAVSTSRRKSI